MNEDIIYNEILRESSVDTKYKPLEKSPNKDLVVLIGVILIGIIICLTQN